MTQPINHVIDADLKAFFDSVSHPGLMKCLQVRIKDPSFLLLIQRFLKAGYFEAGQVVATEQGTPQGGNLSPMLSNIFLHYVLDLWFEKRVKRQARGKCFLVGMRTILSAWFSIRTTPSIFWRRCMSGSRSLIWCCIRRKLA